jgi:hypothetical protein
MNQKQTENDIKNACLAWLRLHGFIAIRVNNGAVTGEHNGKTRFLRFTDTPGVADILACSPKGRFVAVECKAPGKKKNLSLTQQSFLDNIRDAGGIAIVAESIDDLLCLIHE